MKQIMVRDVPDDLHVEFKLLCVRKGISMNRRIIELIREDLKKTKEKRE
jgi:plasmid stability protein